MSINTMHNAGAYGSTEVYGGPYGRVPIGHEDEYSLEAAFEPTQGETAEHARELGALHDQTLQGLERFDQLYRGYPTPVLIDRRAAVLKLEETPFYVVKAIVHSRYARRYAHHSSVLEEEAICAIEPSGRTPRAGQVMGHNHEFIQNRGSLLIHEHEVRKNQRIQWREFALLAGKASCAHLR